MASECDGAAACLTASCATWRHGRRIGTSGGRQYDVGGELYKSEWICFEHTGYARWKAEQWWRRRSPDSVPDTAERAVEIAAGGGLAATKSITVRTVAGEPHERIVAYVVGPMPDAVPAGDLGDYDPDEIPF